MKARIPRVGFTLIELLVVIVVIALLAALILPTFRAAREKGREAQCCNNLHELHIAMWNYTRDHDAHLPDAVSYDWLYSNNIPAGVFYQWQHQPGWVDWANYVHNAATNSKPPQGETNYYWWGSGGRACIIHGSIFSNYIGSASDTNRDLEAYGVYLCPTWRSVCGRDDAVRSYAMNINLSYANLYGITNASQQLLLADQKLQPFTDYRGDGAIQWSLGEGVGTQHLGGKGMVVFLDGHVVKYPESP